MLKGLLAALLGGLLLTGWNYISWEVLGFHQPVFAPTAHEDAVFDVLNSNLEVSGAYLLPRRPSTVDVVGAARTEILDQWKTRRRQGPGVFLFYSKKGTDPDDPMRHVLTLAVAFMACLLVVVLMLTLEQGLPGAIGRMVLVILAGALTTVPHWMHLIWFNAPVEFTIVASLDSLIGWFFASIPICLLVRPFRHV